jgi:thiamine biosynthesis lipoprotein ApbE
LPISPELFQVLEASDRWHALTGGAFDPRARALSDLWSACAKQGRRPSAGELAGAKAIMSQAAWRLDPEHRTAERLSNGPLSLNAIAKGEIVERACNVALEPGRGVSGVLLNLGGDLRVAGDMVQTIAVASPMVDTETSEPFALIEVRDRAVATSGRSQRGFQIQGKWYSHILDPRSGEPADGVASATVIAERSADADALATALNVLDPEDGARLVDALPGVECLIIKTDGQALRSKGWDRFERPLVVALHQGQGGKAEQGDASPGNGFEMIVKFEIQPPTGNPGHYRRPYVAVWIENQDGYPVRNLALWVSLGGSGPDRWLPNLKYWYRSNKARTKVEKADMTLVTARPTRAPGSYSLLWDLKDDHDRPLPAGTYTVFIESAREHGTYQSIRKQITLDAKPFTEELKGNAEIKSASIDYHRKTPAH